MDVHLRFGQTSACGFCEGHSDFGLCSHTSFESLRSPRVPAGRKPRTSQPNSLMGDRKFASDPCVTGTLEA